MKREMGVGLSEPSRRVYLALAQGHIAGNELVKSERGDCDEVKAQAPVCSHCQSLSFRRPPVLSIQIGRAPLDKMKRKRNQNKWTPLKAAMHQLLDRVINKQGRIVID